MLKKCTSFFACLFAFGVITANAEVVTLYENSGVAGTVDGITATGNVNAKNGNPGDCFGATTEKNATITFEGFEVSAYSNIVLTLDAKYGSFPATTEVWPYVVVTTSLNGEEVMVDNTTIRWTAKGSTYSTYTLPLTGNFDKIALTVSPATGTSKSGSANTIYAGYFDNIKLTGEQTESVGATVALSFDDNGFTVTAEPATAHIFCMPYPIEYIEDGVSDAALIDGFLGNYELADDMKYLPIGSATYSYEDYGVEKDVAYAFFAATVEWNEATNAAVRTSDVLRIDTTFASGSVEYTSSVAFAFGDDRFTVTATPATGKIFFLCGAKEYLETELFAEYLTYIESAEDLDAMVFVGQMENTYEAYRIDKSSNTEYVFLAATIEWDATKNAAVMTSELVRVDTVFTASVIDPDPIMTIEPGIYYISTFVDGSTQYLATCLAAEVADGYMNGLLYADSKTPTAQNEFTFVSIADKQGYFTIQDTYGRYLCSMSESDAFAVSATLPLQGAEWRVEMKDYRGLYLITNATTGKNISYTAGTGLYACRAGELETMAMPMLIRIGGIPTALEQTLLESKPAKVIRNGQLVIVKDGHCYHVMGMQL